MRLPAGSADPRLIALATVYFLVYMGVGLQMPYLNLHFARIGLSGAEIGLLAAALPLGAIFGPPLIASFADSRNDKRPLIAGLLLVSGALFCASVLATPVVWILPAVFLFGVVQRSVSPLMDALALEHVAQGRIAYGRLRMWGSIGFVVTALSGGYLAARIGLRPVLLLYMLFAAVSAACCRFLPASAPLAKPQGILQGLRGIRQAPGGRNIFRFAWILVLSNLASATQNTFFAIRIEELGASEAVTGLAFLVATVGEVAMLWYVDAVVDRLGPRGTVALGIAGSALRWWLTAILTAPALVVAIQALHAFSFAAVHGGMVRFIAQSVPESSRASGQAVVNGSRAALAGVIGSFLVGVLYDRWSLSTLYVASSLLAAFSALSMLMLVRDPQAAREDHAAA